MASLRQLGGAYPKSGWQDDARALEQEIRGETGQRPDPSAEADEELKLYALNGLMGSDSKRAVPMLLKFLEGKHSPHLEEQALFVLSQSDSPEAQKVLVEVARGSRYPEASSARRSSRWASPAIRKPSRRWPRSTPRRPIRGSR